MHFEYIKAQGTTSPVTGAATFRVRHLSGAKACDAGATDLSHLIDSSYDYHSPRELRWHLAARFGVGPDAVALSEAA